MTFRLLNETAKVGLGDSTSRSLKLRNGAWLFLQEFLVLIILKIMAFLSRKLSKWSCCMFERVQIAFVWWF